MKFLDVQHFSISSTTNQKAIKADYYELRPISNSVLIFVGGDGDGKNKFDPIINRLIVNNFTNNIFTYTYRGLDEGIAMSLNQKVVDLEDVLHFVINTLKKTNIKLICTSMGSWSTCSIIKQSNYAEVITDILMIDPCDYYVRDSNLNTEEAFIWSGIDKYEPKEPVLSDALLNIKSNVKISIISLIVRNCDKKGYYASTSYSERNKDTPGLYTRLNQDMVKAIYNKIPDRNKKAFAEVNNLPHGFMRDGNIEKNFKVIADIVLQWLS